MYVYRTSHFNTQVEKQNLNSHIEKLCAELEMMSLEEIQSRFERLYPYLKRKEGNLRLIARIYRLDSDYILCWLTIFRRGDRDYEAFLRDRTFHSHNFDNLETTLKPWLKQQKTRLGKQQPVRPSLPQELEVWLQRPNWEMDNTGAIVYESDTWVTRFKLPNIQKAWQAFNQLITEITDTGEEIATEIPWSEVKLYGKEDKYILFRSLTTTDAPRRRVIFLLAPFLEYPTATEIETVISNLTALKNFYQAEPHSGNGKLKETDNRQKGKTVPTKATALSTEFNWDDLTAIARRAYPSYLLADEDMWLAIEQTEAANLALSAEEETILHSVSTSQPSLPLFLNGRAGSGKSTLLFYLFADYCHRHLRLCREQGRNYLTKPHPLFLAYNDTITQYAQERVITLLESHHRFLARRGEKELIPDLTPFFSVVPQLPTQPPTSIRARSLSGIKVYFFPSLSPTMPSNLAAILTRKMLAGNSQLYQRISSR